MWANGGTQTNNKSIYLDVYARYIDRGSEQTGVTDCGHSRFGNLQNILFWPKFEAILTKTIFIWDSDLKTYFQQL